MRTDSLINKVKSTSHLTLWTLDRYYRKRYRAEFRTNALCMTCSWPCNNINITTRNLTLQAFLATAPDIQDSGLVSTTTRATIMPVATSDTRATTDPVSTSSDRVSTDLWPVTTLEDMETGIMTISGCWEEKHPMTQKPVTTTMLTKHKNFKRCTN